MAKNEQSREANQPIWFDGMGKPDAEKQREAETAGIGGHAIGMAPALFGHISSKIRKLLSCYLIEIFLINIYLT